MNERIPISITIPGLESIPTQEIKPQMMLDAIIKYEEWMKRLHKGTRLVLETEQGSVKKRHHCVMVYRRRRPDGTIHIQVKTTNDPD